MTSHTRAARRLALAPAPTPVTAAHTAPVDAILDRIAAGDLDAHLTPIAEAIRARFDLLQAVNSAKALAQLEIGDRVRINHHATPRYLHGVHGTIVHLDDQSAIVCVHQPIGRFTSSEIRCPPLVLDRLTPTSKSQDAPA